LPFKKWGSPKGKHRAYPEEEETIIKRNRQKHIERTGSGKRLPTRASAKKKNFSPEVVDQRGRNPSEVPLDHRGFGSFGKENLQKVSQERNFNVAPSTPLSYGMLFQKKSFMSLETESHGEGEICALNEREGAAFPEGARKRGGSSSLRRRRSSL